jgi:F-type H+-transporting ATPase subunit c
MIMTKRNMKFLLTLGTGLVILLISGAAFAQGDAGSVEAAKAGQIGWIGLGAGLGIGLAAFGGALGQGRAAGTALDGIARNPGAYDKLFTPMILGLALIESLVIYALIISILLLGKM